MTARSAMILAAGRGERLAPLTDVTPKPLLEIAGKPLIDHHLHALAHAGVTQVTVNVTHLSEQIVAHLTSVRPDPVRVGFSHEPQGALETGGGIHNALDLIESDPFIVVNADIWTDFSFAPLPDTIEGLAHLVLVPNPQHHPDGDFVFHDGAVQQTGQGSTTTLTYSGIGLYRKRLFKDCSSGRFPLAPLLNQAAQAGQLSGEVYRGNWMDIGTPQRLEQARRQAEGELRQP
ncbi:MAG: mannose-1-phosphate guanylyltransferase [Acidiferrobacteraceae bacterium]|nr:mannose-1-phosphate guanylyltransferase [Acidiferrobacteraceae bacterium]MDP6919846.1 nucleotidyltransferase family protein [Arenicellales bacterium]